MNLPQAYLKNVRATAHASFTVKTLKRTAVVPEDAVPITPEPLAAPDRNEGKRQAPRL